MTVLVNGQPQAMIAAQDRGLAYGDGVFETILVQQGRPVLLQAHLERLFRGLDSLSISLEESVVTSDLERIISDSCAPEEVLKYTVTRGAGGRGYRPSAVPATRIAQLQPYHRPPLPSGGIEAFTCQTRLAPQPRLAGLKHLNRLEQVLASLEWPDERYQEGLMLSMAGDLIEGTRTNLFLAVEGQWLTPRLGDCGVAGVFRASLLAACPQIREADISPAMLYSAHECFFANSLAGVMPVGVLQMDNTAFRFAPGAFTAAAKEHFDRLCAC